MKDLQRMFDYHGKPVRMVLLIGQPWFVVADVCNILEHSNPTKAVNDLVEADDLTTGEVIDSLGRKQKANIVNEPGLYSLIMGSRKPEAKQFKRWVTHEVLPAIRQTGQYVVPGAAATATAVDPVITELAKRLTISEIITLFEVRCASEGSQYSKNQIQKGTLDIVTHGPLVGRRRHSKVDPYSEDVIRLLMNGHTYKDIQSLLEANREVRISHSSIGRFAKRFLSLQNRSEIKFPSGIQLKERKQ